MKRLKFGNTRFVFAFSLHLLSVERMMDPTLQVLVEVRSAQRESFSGYNLKMPYLIDGHNLIPKIGLRLDSINDEMELVSILQEFCRLERKQVEVYFDGAPTPHAGTRKLGVVTAHFVPQKSSADNAIRNRLKKMGKSAKNWVVVSSDHQVQADARAARAEFISSDSFANILKHARNSAPKSTDDRKLSPQELEEWLNLFKDKKA